eukprot:TRINITY_DN52149_c0_g1_i1.p2 TRINITY_DN52149_c0_g1~~TRINITY_DN52149_c0_g1_i1.p2  ORF type:complete len:193 (-),score=33.61 TRINITY_DN52149_c0_g1_i1:51-629(-)
MTNTASGNPSNTARRASNIKRVGEGLVERAHESAQAKSVQLERDELAAMALLKNQGSSRISGELCQFISGYFGSMDVKRWVHLDPQVGILSIWKDQPPEEVLMAEDSFAKPKRRLQGLCNGTARSGVRPLVVFKMFDLIELDCNKGFFNMFLKFQNPGRTLVLTAPSRDDFLLWLQGLSKYSPTPCDESIMI